MKLILLGKVILLIFIFSLNSNVSAQSELVSTDKLNFYLNEFESKGILAVPADIDHLSEEDLIKINSFDFDVYRKLNSTQNIVLDHGEKLKLKSLNEMVSLGKNVDSSLLSLKENSPNESNLTPIAIKVIVMIGYKDVILNEAWESN